MKDDCGHQHADAAQVKTYDRRRIEILIVCDHGRLLCQLYQHIAERDGCILQKVSASPISENHNQKVLPKGGLNDRLFEAYAHVADHC